MNGYQKSKTCSVFCVRARQEIPSGELFAWDSKSNFKPERLETHRFCGGSTDVQWRLALSLHQHHVQLVERSLRVRL